MCLYFRFISHTIRFDDLILYFVFHIPWTKLTICSYMNCCFLFEYCYLSPIPFCNTDSRRCIFTGKSLTGKAKSHELPRFVLTIFSHIWRNDILGMKHSKTFIPKPETHNKLFSIPEKSTVISSPFLFYSFEFHFSDLSLFLTVCMVSLTIFVPYTAIWTRFDSNERPLCLFWPNLCLSFAETHIFSHLDVVFVNAPIEWTKTKTQRFRHFHWILPFLLVFYAEQKTASWTGISAFQTHTKIE